MVIQFFKYLAFIFFLILKFLSCSHYLFFLMLLNIKNKAKQNPKDVGLLCTLASPYRKTHKSLYTIYDNSSKYKELEIPCLFQGWLT